MKSERVKEHDLDRLLSETLRQTKTSPSPMLNRQILNQSVLEETTMNQKKNNRLSGAAAAAIAMCIVLGGTGSAIAAHKYLSPVEISDAVSDNDRLAKAFESRSAISVNETQVSGDYAFTLLGLVSGSELEPYMPEANAGELSARQTYAAVAISRTDGAEMPEDSFCVSPLIGGVDFATANNGTMNTSLTWFTEGNVTYELMSCDDLEIFADRGVWLSVVDSFGAETRAYAMDDTTGTYSKKADYDGIAALFKLPFDVSKADPDAADAYIDALRGKDDASADDTQTENSDDGHPAWVTELVGKLDENNINDYFTLQPEYSLTATPDAEGWIDFGSVYIKSEDHTHTGSSGMISLMIEDGTDFMVTGFGYSDDPKEDLCVNTLTRNADGSFTEDQYIIK